MLCHSCNRDLPMVAFPKPGYVCQECLEKIEHLLKQEDCACSGMKSLNCGMKCSNCGREL